jgi:hypothetical protein
MSTRFARLFMLQCNIAFAALAMAACGGGSGTTCTQDTDCPSHFCRADGTCAPADVDAPQGSGTDGAPTDGSGGGACSPDHDGHITLAELPLAAGRMATFRVTTSGTWDTAGTSSSGGGRAWDLSGQLSGDADVPVALARPAGAWWAGDFPTATYAATLASSSDLIGVFHVDANAVTLLGVVSPTGGSFATNLAYSPPAKILALPISAGGTWTSTSSVTGTAQGVFSAYSEKYASRVDQVGTMKTPYGTFPVVRIATDLTRTEGLATLTTQRTFAWVAECFGSVATVTSQAFETADEFDNPSEVRRLTP